MSLDLDHHRITEIVRPIESGMTEPVLCVLDDDNTYCVKGKGALARGKISEVLCAVLGRSIGLPIPDFAIASLSPAMVAQGAYDATVRRIGSEPSFASLWKEPISDFLIVMRQDFPASLLASVYVFDHWIRNDDRTLTDHGGNVNLLVNLATKELVVIDHNLAFSATYAVADLPLHVGHQSWRSLDRRKEFSFGLRERMLRAKDELNVVADCLPDEWLEQEPDLIDHALETLDRVSGNEFWDELA
ncbi:HipA family kinase [Novosphingobium lindaniclasticum]|uniref:HipA family kinase n=1 Tax=Novosphingobium lindaniclasticum TaxID=1329895 RepID=UPI001267F48B|nr:HipA family kinase [Novosphingobium lindaniclasticum]